MNNKIAVIGLGGVGGYLAGLLSSTFDTVTVVARGARYDAVSQHGVVLHSELNGEVSGHPAAVCRSVSELGPQDYIFISVKNYSLEEVLKDLGNAVTEKTVVIPVMNGVDPGDRVKAALPCGIVVKSLIYIVSFSRPDFSVEQQGDFADIYIGIKDPAKEEQNAVENVASLLQKSGIHVHTSADIEVDIWKKYVLNCCYNVCTAYYDLPIGDLRRDPVKASEYEALAREAYQVAVAKGVSLSADHVKNIIDKFYKYADNATSSLQRDIHDGKPAEIETFSGYIVKEARKLGIQVPVSARMYDGLLKAAK